MIEHCENHQPLRALCCLEALCRQLRAIDDVLLNVSRKMTQNFLQRACESLKARVDLDGSMQHLRRAVGARQRLLALRIAAARCSSDATARQQQAGDGRRFRCSAIHAGLPTKSESQETLRRLCFENKSAGLPSLSAQERGGAHQSPTPAVKA